MFDRCSLFNGIDLTRLKNKLTKCFLSLKGKDRVIIRTDKPVRLWEQIADSHFPSIHHSRSKNRFELDKYNHK